MVGVGLAVALAGVGVGNAAALAAGSTRAGGALTLAAAGLGALVTATWLGRLVTDAGGAAVTGIGAERSATKSPPPSTTATSKPATASTGVVSRPLREVVACDVAPTVSAKPVVEWTPPRTLTTP